jgi:hypothetical protein
MSRLIRNTFILAKIETTAGTDATPAGATDALLISNATFENVYNNVDRALIRGYMGGSDQLAGSRSVKATFEVEVSGSGAAGTAPAWGKLLQACAFAEVTAASYVTYMPVSAALQTITIYYYRDGLLHKMLGSMGSVDIGADEGARPVLKFSFMGIDAGAVTAANPTQTLSNWKTPLVITDPNTGDIKLGSSYATGAITGGTSYMSRGINISMANDTKHISMLGGQYISITNRQPTGSVQLELTATQEASFMTDINANTLTSMSFEHGTTAGGKVAFYAPAVQRINPKHADYQGIVNLGLDLRLLPIAGNDELVIITS